MNMPIELQLGCTDGVEIPCSATINQWVNATFSVIEHAPESLTVRIVNEQEISELNRRYRGQNKPTNVLSFPFEAVAEVDYSYLGDIIICSAVVKKESHQQDKSIQSHFAHIVIHGTLHLCGFDHQTDDEAAVMEEAERTILTKIGVL